jgi:homogentisate 1,2-dioxygenase
MASVVAAPVNSDAFDDHAGKTGGGFRPAGASLPNIMSAQGPDASSHRAASEAKLKPQKVGSGSMAFMFESCLMIGGFL